MNRNKEPIDLLQLAAALWKRAWAIALTAALLGAAALLYTVMLIKPLYKAEALMYVNSSDISVGGTKLSISQAELNAAQSLVDTYIVILNTRTTLEDVIQQSGVSYSYEQLRNMIHAAAVNNTEIFSIEVTSTSPQEAELLANTIAGILPDKIAAIVEGSSARVVDYAVVPAKKASPSVSRNTALGILLGIVLSCGVIAVVELMDEQIYDSDYLMKTYDIPVLAVIPDLLSSRSDKYYSDNYYYQTYEGQSQK